MVEPLQMQILPPSSATGLRIGFDTLVENPLSPSSAFNYLQSILRALVEVGPEHQYFVFVSPKNRKFFQMDAANVHLIDCFFSNENIPLRILVQQIYYPLLVRRFRLDVVHALSQIPLLASCASVVKVCGLHHHLIPGEFMATNGRSLWHPLRLLYRRLIWDSSARRSTLVIANSTATQEGIVRFMGLNANRIRIVFETVDEAFSRQFDAGDSRAAIRRDYGVGRDYVLYVSNLWFYKNPDGAIRSFARQIAKYADDLDLVIAGPDDFNRRTELRRLARDCGVEDRVHFLGRVPFKSLLKLYSAARVMYYPSLVETFGKPVLEAMRAGVPVVAARATSLPELVGNAGILVDPLDVEANADALHRAATDDILRKDLIQKGKIRAQDFSWEATARGTLRVCADAAAIYHKKVLT
jgi:glycosyltransferase involved in cell wall biosynthesis